VSLLGLAGSVKPAVGCWVGWRNWCTGLGRFRQPGIWRLAGSMTWRDARRRGWLAATVAD